MGYYCHTSKGRLVFDPGRDTKHYSSWWAILETDPGILDFYCWLSLKWGVLITRNNLWGPHISVIKGEEPPNKGLWGHDFGLVDFSYTNTIRYDNGCHAWLDVHSSELNDIRAEFGLSRKINFGDHPRHFHMTLGRWLSNG